MAIDVTRAHLRRALLLRRIGAAAHRPVDAASLVVLRVAFGALLALACVRFWHHGWIHEHFVRPERFLTHWGLGWVRPLPGAGMYVVYAAMTATAASIAAGVRPRLAAGVFTALFTYAHLCDVTHYLNHYVLVSLLGALLTALPVARWGGSVPAWTVWLIRFQIGVVYFFGGVGKLNTDWLLRAEPLSTWLARAGDVPLLGAAAGAPWLAFSMSWAGAVFDLSVPFLLLGRRTRLPAYAAACAFHLVTARLFQLGMFPWLMMAFAPVFFPPSWPRDLATRLGIGAGRTPLPERRDAAAASPWPLRAAIAVVVLQLLVPLRGLLYPGDGLWTEQGFRFAWKVMLVEKNGDVAARVSDRATGRTSIVEPRELFDPLQSRMLSTQPDLLLQFAHAVRDRERARGRDVEVRLDVFVAMNGRRSQRLVDPDVDLAREADGLGTKGWILPLHVVPRHIAPLDVARRSLPLSQRSGS